MGLEQDILYHYFEKHSNFEHGCEVIKLWPFRTIPVNFYNFFNTIVWLNSSKYILLTASFHSQDPTNSEWKPSLTKASFSIPEILAFHQIDTVVKSLIFDYTDSA